MLRGDVADELDKFQKVSGNIKRQTEKIKLMPNV